MKEWIWRLIYPILELSTQCLQHSLASLVFLSRPQYLLLFWKKL
uniref:Uncharacterized protein n=1 Tax=Arundo donax TaxID=35708 RepID=A0A0A9DZY5_ARUDO